MILSDGEIKRCLEAREIIIDDPPPAMEQYTSTALDLLLGGELKRFKTPEELQSEEPPGVHRPLIVEVSKMEEAHRILDNVYDWIWDTNPARAIHLAAHKALEGN